MFKQGPDFSHRDKRLFKTSEVVITRVDCKYVIIFAGIWGSAFCIQLKRLLQDDKKVTTLLAIEQEREELGECQQTLCGQQISKS